MNQCRLVNAGSWDTNHGESPSCVSHAAKTTLTKRHCILNGNC